MEKQDGDGGKPVAEEQKSGYWATGRRKKAIAQVKLTPGAGTWKANGKKMEDYFVDETLCEYVRLPMKLTDMLGKFDVSARLRGGGIVGQAGAFRHGVARALCLVDGSLRGVLKKKGMLTRDPRMRERKKTGQPGARKRFQFSKR